MLEKREILSRTESLDARNEAVEKARQDDKQQQLQGLTAKLSARGPASARSRRVAESSPSRSQAGVAEAKVEHSKMSGSPSQLSLSMIAENDQALMQSISVPCSGLPNPDNEGDDDEFPDLSDSASDDIYDVSDNSSEEEGDELSVADVFSFVAKMVSSRRTHLLDLFREVDEDSSGELNHEEVRVLLRLAGLEGQVDEALFREFFDELDENGDGSITYIGFSRAIKKRMRAKTQAWEGRVLSPMQHALMSNFDSGSSSPAR